MSLLGKEKTDIGTGNKQINKNPDKVLLTVVVVKCSPLEDKQCGVRGEEGSEVQPYRALWRVGGEEQMSDSLEDWM